MVDLQDPPAVPGDEREAAFADWRHDPTITFARKWVAADDTSPPTAAERRTFEAIDIALQTMGLIIELDEHGHPFPADEVDDPMFWPRTPELVADALTRVDQAAEHLRRERHRDSTRVWNLPAPRPVICATAQMGSPRARESRPQRPAPPAPLPVAATTPAQQNPRRARPRPRTPSCGKRYSRSTAPTRAKSRPS